MRGLWETKARVGIWSFYACKVKWITCLLPTTHVQLSEWDIGVEENKGGQRLCLKRNRVEILGAVRRLTSWQSLIVQSIGVHEDSDRPDSGAWLRFPGRPFSQSHSQCSCFYILYYIFLLLYYIIAYFTTSNHGINTILFIVKEESSVW